MELLLQQILKELQEINANTRKAKPKKKETKEVQVLSKLDNVINEFIKHRVKIKKPMTDYAVKMLRVRLDKLAETEEKQIDLINLALEKGWQNVYLPKDGLSDNVKAILTPQIIDKQFKDDQLNQYNQCNN